MAVTGCSYALVVFLERRCPICTRYSSSVCEPCWAALATARVRWLASPEPGTERDLEVRSLFAYGPEAAALVLAAKNGGRRSVLRQFGTEMARQVLDATVEVVTWVPATRHNRRRRGFDQGRVMARCVAAELGVPARRLLDHRHQERPGVARPVVAAGQKGKGRAERQAGANLAATRPIRGRVLLIDDVITTGASLRHGADALYSAGADHVMAITAASADREVTFGSSP